MIPSKILNMGVKIPHKKIKEGVKAGNWEPWCMRGGHTIYLALKELNHSVPYLASLEHQLG